MKKLHIFRCLNIEQTRTLLLRGGWDGDEGPFWGGGGTSVCELLGTIAKYLRGAFIMGNVYFGVSISEFGDHD